MPQTSRLSPVYPETASFLPVSSLCTSAPSRITNNLVFCTIVPKAQLGAILMS